MLYKGEKIFICSSKMFIETSSFFLPDYISQFNFISVKLKCQNEIKTTKQLNKNVIY